MSWQLKDKLQKIVAEEAGTLVYAPGSRQGFVLAYPNTYNVGMSNLGFQIIYQEINRRGDTACERLFLPDKKMAEEYSRTNTPLMTLETQRPVHEFELVAFAVSFEMDYFNLLNMLALGRIPLLAAERDDNYPLVIIGGPCATFNPEPLADFIDAAIIGEGEEVINEFLDVYYKGRQDGLSRQELLLSIAGISGVYVPRFYQPEYDASSQLTGYKRLADVAARVSRRWIKDLDDYAGQTVIVTDDTEFNGMYLIEISRGCGRHCRFCMAGYCFRRPRARSYDKVVAAVKDAAEYRNKVGLVGAAISDYPEIDKLCEYILSQGMKLSVASLRADSLTATLAKALAISGHKTLTLAPEAASDRLRRVVNKGITEQHLAQAVAMAIEAGIPNIRLYIMVGLPYEVEADIEQIITMTVAVKQQMERLGSKGKLTLSINPFIPKPFTPFQWVAMTDSAVVEKRLKKIQAAFRGNKGIEVLIESPREAYVQGVLARGDRRLGAVLLAAQQRGGSKAWRQALKENEIDPDLYLYRKRDLDEVFPWQVIDIGLNENYLKQEYRNAAEEKATAVCQTGCKRCGVCS
ncbi:MAG: radical family uncharacterized protein [Firmicutes bacterium]|nr:radical family uncharacterized protein [Bacillota bacterium]